MNIHWRFSFGLALLALSAMGGLSWSLQYSPRTSLRDHWRAELLNDDSDKRLLLGQLAELTPPDIATLVKYAGSADPLLADHSQRLLNELVVKFQHHSSEYQENNLSTLIHEIKKQYASTKATSHPFFYNLVFQLLEDSTLNETKSQKNFLADCRSILEMYGKDPYPKEHLVASHQELDPVRRLTELQELINELERQSHLAGGQLGIEPVTPKSPFEIVTPIISENEMKEQTIFKESTKANMPQRLPAVDNARPITETTPNNGPLEIPLLRQKISTVPLQQRTLLPQTIQKQSWQEGDSQQLSLLQNDWPSHKPAHHPIDDHSAHGKSTFGFIPTTKDLLPPVHRDNFLKQSLFTEKLSFKIVGDGVLPRIHMTKFSTLKELLGPRGDFSQLP